VISFKSIFSRIIFLHVIALVITAIFMPVVLYWFLRSAANDLHAQAMREQADLVAHYLQGSDDGGWTLDLPPALQDLYSQAYGRYAYAVIDDAGVLFSSSKDGAAIFPHDPRTSATAFLETQRGEARLSGVSIARRVGERLVWIEVGEDLAHRDVIIDDIVADFFKRVGWIILPILLFLLLIDVVIFRRALRPVLNASELAKKISPTRTDLRLSEESIPDEILPLVQAVNQAFERLEIGFRVQREFTADAAHELRTPLTILRSRVDTLGDKAAAAALQRDIDGMTRIVSQLLDIAELETFAIDPAEKADLRGICAELAEFAAPLALAQGKHIALSGAAEPVRVNGNGEMISRAVRNLIENALNHSPAGQTVEIIVEKPGVVHVLDDGPGIKNEERALIFRRFWRRDRRRSGSAGLGLAIVKRIADAHGAMIKVENRAGGGAAFSLIFG
jgi:signal transduction histidine kinase